MLPHTWARSWCRLIFGPIAAAIINVELDASNGVGGRAGGLELPGRETICLWSAFAVDRITTAANRSSGGLARSSSFADERS